MIPAVILAGGLGTRLRSITGDLPKALAPIQGRPFLEYQLEWLKRQGIVDVLLCVGYRHDLIQAHFGDGSACGMQIHYSIEEQPLGTAGALVNARQQFEAVFLVLNGDTYFEAELAPVLEAHAVNRVPATMGLVHVANTVRQGAVVLDDARYVTQFIEKGRTGPGLINAGVYVLSSTVFDFFPERLPVSLENDVFTRLVRERQLRGCALSGYHIDIGIPESYAQFEADMRNRGYMTAHT